MLTSRPLFLQKIAVLIRVFRGQFSALIRWSTIFLKFALYTYPKLAGEGSPCITPLKQHVSQRKPAPKNPENSPLKNMTLEKLC
jgi:hypothetical protein